MYVVVSCASMRSGRRSQRARRWRPPPTRNQTKAATKSGHNGRWPATTQNNTTASVITGNRGPRPPDGRNGSRSRPNTIGHRQLAEHHPQLAAGARRKRLVDSRLELLERQATVGRVLFQQLDDAVAVRVRHADRVWRCHRIAHRERCRRPAVLVPGSDGMTTCTYPSLRRQVRPTVPRCPPRLAAEPTRTSENAAMGNAAPALPSGTGT